MKTDTKIDHATDAAAAPKEDDPAVASQIGTVSVTEPQTSPRDADLPTWTHRYPPAVRRLLANVGYSPIDYPRGHEANVAIIAIAAAFEKCGWSMGDDFRPWRPGDDYRRGLFWDAVLEALSRVEVTWPADTPAANLTMVDRWRVALPPPRDPAEFEPPVDWFKIFPAEYQDIVRAHGVPAVAHSPPDIFNRHLVRVLPPGCTDGAAIENAQRAALAQAFGPDLSWKYKVEEEHSDHELFEDRLPSAEYLSEIEDELWAHYPAEERSLLQSVGRADHEHANAAFFNRAIMGATRCMGDLGMADQAALVQLRGSLWRQFFPDEECPA